MDQVRPAGHGPRHPGDEAPEGAVTVPDLLGIGPGGGLTGRLERWAAEARVDEAARRRARERWLLQQAEEEGTFAGVLADLAERGAAVAVHTVAGAQHAGRIGVVGADFVAVGRPGRPEVLVRTGGVVAVRTRPGEPPTVGDRRVDPELTLAEVLAWMAAERERVALVLGAGGAGGTGSGAGGVPASPGSAGSPAGSGAGAVAGTLRGVGDDVVTLRLDLGLDAGQPPATCYVPLGAIAEVRLGPGG